MVGFGEVVNGVLGVVGFVVVPKWCERSNGEYFFDRGNK